MIERIKEVLNNRHNYYIDSKGVTHDIIEGHPEDIIEEIVNSNSLVISANFSPKIKKWTGLCVEMGIEGTHKDYNVVYNGDCINERFDTEQEAKQAALYVFKLKSKTHEL